MTGLHINELMNTQNKDDFVTIWSQPSILFGLEKFYLKIDCNIKSSLPSEHQSFFSLAILSLAGISALIEKDVNLRKSAKLVDGGAYELMDLVSKQIACTSSLDQFLKFYSEMPSSMLLARKEAFLLNLKEVILDLSKLSSLSADLAKCGEFQSFVIVKITALSDSEVITHHISLMPS
ncbi:MAG: hypothetical protein SGJ02_13840 [bacterium]|nr:hypothetical protein [bacterium]